jgi:hypothetical protein
MDAAAMAVRPGAVELSELPRERFLEWRLDRAKWIIVHSRMTDSITFGPFDSREEAEEWAREHGVGSLPSPLVLPDEGGTDTMWMGWR